MTIETEMRMRDGAGRSARRGVGVSFFAPIFSVRMSLARQIVAQALVALILLYSALASIGAMRAYGPLEESARFAGALCFGAPGAATPDPGADPEAPPRSGGFHCLLCSLAQGGCGPATPSVVTFAPAPRFARLVATPAPDHGPAPPPLAGWASSWSSRAPPFAV